MLKKLIIILLIGVITIILIIIFLNRNYPEKSQISKFIKQYYTVEEIVSTDNINQELIDNEVSKYVNLLESKCLERFVNNRELLRNKQFAYENQCTLSVERTEIQFVDKIDNGVRNYKFNISVIASYKGNEIKKKTSVSGIIQIKLINKKPMITYISIPYLDID